MKPPTGTPCGECPWRRKAWPGYTGPLEPGEWVEMAHGEGFIACHLTIVDDENYEEERDVDDMTQCSGAAIYRSNVCKMPWSGAATLPADRDQVFSWRNEFIEHHRREVKQ